MVKGASVGGGGGHSAPSYLEGALDHSREPPLHPWQR